VVVVDVRNAELMETVARCARARAGRWAGRPRAAGRPGPVPRPWQRCGRCFAEQSVPLTATRAQHEVLLALHSGARTCRALTHWSAQAGLPVHYPFLAVLGIVDADALRRAALGLYPPRLSYALLEATLATETWLRAHPTPTPAAPPAPARQA